MKRLAVLAAFALLAACQPASGSAADDVPSAQVVAQAGAYDIYKVCDHGRAVYAMAGSGKALAVVENAPECA